MTDAAGEAGLDRSAKLVIETLRQRAAGVPLAPLILMGLAALGFVYLVFRNTGLMPWVMGDERMYSYYSRLAPLSDATIPNYLYYFVYGLANQCGDAFLDCARALNSVFFLSAIPIIYAVARKVCSPAVALMICAITALGPANAYTAFFTPEPLYFFGFWALTWAVLRVPGPAPLRSWIVIGVMVGLLSLVKPHALFLLAGLGLYLALLSRRHQRAGWIRSAALATVSLVAATLLTKFALGYAFAGENGLSLFGTLYGSGLSRLGHEGLATLLSAALTSLEGHVPVLAALFGLPLVVLVAATVRSSGGDGASTESRRISAYTLSLLVSLVLIVALFSAHNSEERRLYIRTYDFVFPLLLIAVGARIPKGSDTPLMPFIRTRFGLIFMVLVVLLGAIAMVTVQSPVATSPTYFASVFDAPWLIAWSQGQLIAYLVVIASLLLVLLARLDVIAASKLYAVVLMPILAIGNSLAVSQSLAPLRHPDVYATAGSVAHDLLTPEERARLVVVGQYVGNLLGSLMFVDTLGATLMTVADTGDGLVDESDLTAAANGTAGSSLRLPELALLIGVTWAGDEPLFEMTGPGFSLVRLPGARTIDFTQASWFGLLSRTEGLSGPGGPGRWSSGKTVRLEFVSPLPESFALHLRGGAFGPNIGEPIWVQVGQQRKSFTLGAGPEDVAIEFDHAGSPSEISFEIPHPVSPLELGLSADPSELGIWLAELRVDERPSD